MPLNARKQRFVEEYLVDLNATQAAIRAGYSAKTAHSAGPRLLGNVEIAHAIAQQRDALSKKTGITTERVLSELSRVAFASMGDYIKTGADGLIFFDFSNIDDAKSAVISEVTVEEFKDGKGEGARDVRRVKFKLHDKLNALNQIGRHLGMFVDRHEHSGKDGGPMQVQIVRFGDADNAAQ